ncbi:metal-sulfur cluster assembly factor [Weissella diestrammenae]|uniref:Metal-sulfur cluster assembly factor n=1 Tax=Weissella diestrammenae TaxID=1162633 RepID=A0A7G9T4X5_9LACO|nr:metal-sulfur cluster assembly factor [Weissella diestrammenae]MCM0582867.1 metal-sulfur cluster assembly factor [Weissella diestrammenae]QNN75150.1 metal-sulfur cluster assembly factor [Weissella diestrammenae]
MNEIENNIWHALTMVEDPELRCDIVNLGLIYGVKVSENAVMITMTWTMMGCPLSDLLEKRIRRAVLNVPGIKSVDLHVVFEPAWSKDRMTPYARLLLGIH